MVSKSSTFTLNMTYIVCQGEFLRTYWKGQIWKKIVSTSGFISSRPPPPGWKRSWWPNPAGLAPTGTFTCLTRTSTSCPGTPWWSGRRGLCLEGSKHTGPDLVYLARCKLWIEACQFPHQEPKWKRMKINLYTFFMNSNKKTPIAVFLRLQVTITKCPLICKLSLNHLSL